MVQPYPVPDDPSEFATWAFWQQVLRYFMAWGGTAMAGAGLPDNLAMGLSGLALAAAGGVWWWVTFRKAKPAT